MRLSKKEKILLVLLAFAGLGYLLFQYVITPQQAAIAELQKTRDVWEQKRQELLVIDEKITQMDKQLREINDKIQTTGNKYFSQLSEQEETIVILSDILQVSGISDTSITFEPLQKTNIDAAGKGSKPKKGSKELLPQLQTIKLNFSGDYKTLWNLLRGFWNSEKCIVVNDLNIKSSNKNGEIAPALEKLTGSVSILLYDLSDITKNSSSLVKWGESGSFRKANPFEPGMSEVFPGTRYTLIRGDTPTSKYVKFADISGHWAEAAIDDFGNRQLITGDLANRYFPDDDITRGELVIMLDKVFKWEAPPTPVDLTGFKDYKELGQSLSAMEKAFYKGYLNKYFVGYSDGSLKPNVPITYEEFELVMGRILNKKEFKWSDAAKAIEADTEYQSKGIGNIKANMTRAEAVYYLNSLKLK